MGRNTYINSIPAEVQNLLKLLEGLSLAKIEEYKSLFISNQLTVETLRELSEKDLKKFLTEELKVGILDANKITKAILGLNFMSKT